MSKYIFPGADASIPLSDMSKALEKVGFQIQSVENISIHYSETIRLWHLNWQKHSAAVLQAYGERWYRLWHLFLGWSWRIAAQGTGQGFQLVAHKNLDSVRPQDVHPSRGQGQPRPARARSRARHDRERQRPGARGIRRRPSPGHRRIREAAHAAASRTIASSWPLAAARSAGRAPGSPRLPSTRAALRARVARPARLRGVPCDAASQDASSSERSCSRRTRDHRSRGAKGSPSSRDSGARALAPALKGHTVWQSSQPNRCDPIPFAKIRSDLAVMLDRQIRHAPARIEHERRDERRASGTPRCSACMSRSDPSWAPRDRGAASSRTSPEEHHRPDAWHDEHPVLADEPQPGPRRPRALEHRARRRRAGARAPDAPVTRAYE